MEHFLNDLKILFSNPEALYPYQVEKRQEMIAVFMVLVLLTAFFLFIFLLVTLLIRLYKKTHPEKSGDAEEASPHSDPAASSAPLPEGTLSTAEKLQTLRRSRGLSQEQLANQLNISRQAISKWELGDSFPDAENLLALSRLYGVSIDYILNPDWTQPPAAVPAPVPFWKKAVDWFGRNAHYIGYGISAFFAFELIMGSLPAIAMELFLRIRFRESMYDDPTFVEMVAPSLSDWGVCLIMIAVGLLFAKCCRDWQKKHLSKRAP